MAKPKEPEQVKLFIGILYSDAEPLAKAKVMLREKYGDIDYESPPFEFKVTDYYCAEMGSPICRVFLSFRQLINPKEIARIKMETNDLEEQLAVVGKRRINLDPGYLDTDKVVLASAKYRSQKVYLDFGIYADLTLHYEKGNYYPFPWSFPDFKSGEYNRAFQRIRELYKVQRKDR